MANEQLRQALLDAGIEIEELAVQLGVDFKTAQRWLAGQRTPYPRYQHKAARILNTAPELIWPVDPPAEVALDGQTNLLPTGEDGPGFAGEVITVNWSDLLARATDQIDLLDYTLAGVLYHPDFVDQIRTKAAGGASVRILVVAPWSPLVDQADDELSPPPDFDDEEEDSDWEPGSTIRDEAAGAREMLWTLDGTPGIEIRQHTAQRFNAILRFDDTMLVLLHLYGVRAQDAPRIYTEQNREDRLFEQFADHFTAIWDRAYPFREPLFTVTDELEDGDALLEENSPLNEQNFQFSVHHAQDELRQVLREAHAEYRSTRDQLDRRREAYDNSNPTGGPDGEDL